MKQPLSVSSRRRSSNPFKLFRAAASIAVLTGPIYAQVIPGQAITRTFDNGSADLTWANSVNWSADTLPGIDDIANFNVAQAVVTNIDLGAQSWEMGGLIFSANGAGNYIFQNGSLVTNNLSQNADDPNAINPTVSISTKNAGTDVLNVSVTSNTLQLQGLVKAGGLNKFGGTVLRLGTSGTAFNGAINGDINLYGGTLTASGANTATGNPLAGTGNLVAQAFGTGTVQLTLDTTGSLDFGRNIVLNSNLTIANNRFDTTNPTNAEQRVGTITMGSNILRVFHNGTAAGYFTATDGLIINGGSTATVQVDTSGRLEAEYLKGAADTKVIKTGNAELRLRGNGTDLFEGDLEIRDGIVRLDNITAPAIGSSNADIIFSPLNTATSTLQLRSETSVDYAANVMVSPGVFSGTISVDRVSAATAQTLSLGNATISNGTTLNVTGANTYALALDGIIIGAGSTGTFNPTSANVTASQLTVGAGGTFVKTGGSALTLNSDNSATALGTLLIRQGTVTATATGALGAGLVTVGNDTLNAAGFVVNSAQLNYNASGASANTTGTDVTVFGASQVTLGTVPTPAETFSVKSRGVILGSAGELGALTIGGNLTLENDTVIAHENVSTGATSVVGLSNTPTYFFGIGGTANTVPAVGEGTPWKGFSNDRAARSIIGAGGVPATVTLNGADDNPNTIEVTLQGLNGQTLSFGSNASTETYSFTSVGGVATPAATKSTLVIKGYGGTSIGLTPGGNVALEDTAAGTNLVNAVDKIYIQSGTLLLGSNGSLGGVPVEVQSGGAIDVRTTAAMDGPVNIKDGGVLFLNDNFQLTGSGVITIEQGGKLDITNTTPANILLSTQTINFSGTGHTVRFAASDITNLDTTVPNAGVTYVIAGGATAAIVPGTNANVTTNTQTAGLSLDNGILTNDATSRALTGALNLNNTNFTAAATQGTTLVITGDAVTTGTITIGTPLGAIDNRIKTDAIAFRADGLLDPHASSPTVLFTGAFGASSVTVYDSHLGFANANTNIAGDLNFQGNVLYLDGGGSLNGGSSVRGDLTARLTDTTGLPANRFANRIILGNYARIEMTVAGSSATITQPFVITGKVNPLDKRTFWVDRLDTTVTPAVFFSDVLLKDGAQYGFDENGTAVRSNIKVEGNAELVRIDDWDLRNVSKAPGAPANVTISVGQPTIAPGGSSGSLIQSVDGTVDSGITMDLIRGQLFFEASAVLNGIVRTQTAPAGGDSFVVVRSASATTDTALTGTGEIQLGRSAAAAGPEDMEVRVTEVTTGNPALQHMVAVPVRVVNDGDDTNIDGILRSERNNDSNVNGRVLVNTVNVDSGATLQTAALTQTPLTVQSVSLGANSGIDSTNNNSVFLGQISGSTNTIRFSGPAQARVTGNITAGQINVVGAGLDFDPGFLNTSLINAPVSLSGLLTVRSGTADFGTNIITGAPVQTLPGLRENKTQGSFDEVTPNSSNEIKLGPVMAQLPTNTWGENQTVTYTGQINIPDNGTIGDNIGTVAFAKWFDDSIKIVIDGTTYMRNTTFNDGVASGAISLTPGLHDIEIRLGQGTGGAGPVVQDGGIGLGLGIDLIDPVDATNNGGLGLLTNGGNFVAPLDNGTGNLFKTTTVKAGLTVSTDGTLSAGGFTNIGTAAVSGNGTLIVTGAGASNADVLSVNGSATVVVSQASATVTIATQKVEGQLTKSGAGTLVMNGNDPSFGTFIFLTEGTVVLNGSMSGDVQMSGGRFSGNATVTNSVDATAGGVIAPGNGRGTMTIGNLFADSSSTFDFEIGRLGTGAPVAGVDYDQLKINGSFYDLGGTSGNGNGAILSLKIVGDISIGDIFTLILNQSLDSDSGTFANLPNNSTITQNGYQFVISYFDDPFSPAFETAGGNAISLLVTVPEPSSAMVIFSGLATLAGMRRLRRRRG